MRDGAIMGGMKWSGGESRMEVEWEGGGGVRAEMEIESGRIDERGKTFFWYSETACVNVQRCKAI